MPATFWIWSTRAKQSLLKYVKKNVKSHPIVELFSAGFDYLKLLCTAGGCRVPANWVRFSELETKTNQRQKVFFNFQLLLKSKLKFQTTSAEKFSETVSSTIVISDCFRFVVLQVNIILRCSPFCSTFRCILCMDKLDRFLVETEFCVAVMSYSGWAGWNLGPS